jgi:hypothetical protein
MTKYELEDVLSRMKIVLEDTKDGDFNSRGTGIEDSNEEIDNSVQRREKDDNILHGGNSGRNNNRISVIAPSKRDELIAVLREMLNDVLGDDEGVAAKLTEYKPQLDALFTPPEIETIPVSKCDELEKLLVDIAVFFGGEDDCGHAVYNTIIFEFNDRIDALFTPPEQPTVTTAQEKGFNGRVTVVEEIDDQRCRIQPAGCTPYIVLRSQLFDIREETLEEYKKHEQNM